MTDRHQFRAKWHPYLAGAYFLTLCIAGRKQLFGEIKAGEMKLNGLGYIVNDCIINTKSPLFS